MASNPYESLPTGDTAVLDAPSSNPYASLPSDNPYHDLPVDNAPAAASLLAARPALTGPDNGDDTIFSGAGVDPNQDRQNAKYAQPADALRSQFSGRAYPKTISGKNTLNKAVADVNTPALPVQSTVGQVATAVSSPPKTFSDLIDVGNQIQQNNRDTINTMRATAQKHGLDPDSVAKLAPLWEQYLQGIGNAGVETAASLASPVGLATLGFGSIPKAAQKAASLGFSAQMISQFPEQAKQLLDEENKTGADRDESKIAKLLTGLAASGAFGVAAAAHGTSPEFQPETAAHSNVSFEQPAAINPLKNEPSTQTPPNPASVVPTATVAEAAPAAEPVVEPAAPAEPLKTDQQAYDELVAKYGLNEKGTVNLEKPQFKVQPALEINGKIYKGGDTHGEIFDKLPQDVKDEYTLAPDVDAQHIFLDENENKLSRTDLQKKLGVSNSEDIPAANKIQQAKALTPEEISAQTGANYDGEIKNAKGETVKGFTFKNPTHPLKGVTFNLKGDVTPEIVAAKVKELNDRFSGDTEHTIREGENGKFNIVNPDGKTLETFPNRADAEKVLPEYNTPGIPSEVDAITKSSSPVISNDAELNDFGKEYQDALTKSPELRTPRQNNVVDVIGQVKQITAKIEQAKKSGDIGGVEAGTAMLRGLKSSLLKMKSGKFVYGSIGGNRQSVVSAFKAGKPVNAEAAEHWGMKIPNGYVKQGDVYTKNPKPERETITPANDKVIGKNSAGETLHQNASGSVYRIRNDRADRPNGYPDFGGDLASVEKPPSNPVPSTRGEDVLKAAVEKGLIEKTGDLPTHEGLNIKREASKAVDFINKNPDEALKISKGEENNSGVRPEAVYTALEEKAIQGGDVATLRELANSSLPTEAGQRLKLLDSNSPFSPVKIMRDIRNARESASERRTKTTKEKVVKEIKQSITRNRSRLESWEDVVRKLACN